MTTCQNIAAGICICIYIIRRRIIVFMHQRRVCLTYYVCLVNKIQVLLLWQMSFDCIAYSLGVYIMLIAGDLLHESHVDHGIIYSEMAKSFNKYDEEVHIIKTMKNLCNSSYVE